MKGLYFEKARQRWRARLYHQGRVVHRSYHRTREDAEQTLARALAKRRTLKRGNGGPTPATPAAILVALRVNAHRPNLAS